MCLLHGTDWIITYSLQNLHALIKETRVRSWISSCEIHGLQSGTKTGFSPGTSILPCQYHSTNAHMHRHLYIGWCKTNMHVSKRTFALRKGGGEQAAESAHRQRNDDVPFQKLVGDNGSMEHAAC